MTTAKMETPADALTDIERQLTALGDQGDVLNTANAQAAYHGKRSALWNRRQAIHASTAMLAQVAPKIAADEKWLDDLTTWREVLDAELLAMHPRVRNEKELATQQNLTTSIRIIDFGRRADGEWTRDLETLPLGDLMRASGYVQAPPEANTNQAFGPLPWFGSLAEVEGRLKELRARRDDAQRRLDGAMRDAVTV